MFLRSAGFWTTSNDGKVARFRLSEDGIGGRLHDVGTRENSRHYRVRHFLPVYPSVQSLPKACIGDHGGARAPELGINDNETGERVIGPADAPLLAERL